MQDLKIVLFIALIRLYIILLFQCVFTAFCPFFQHVLTVFCPFFQCVLMVFCPFFQHFRVQRYNFFWYMQINLLFYFCAVDSIGLVTTTDIRKDTPHDRFLATHSATPSRAMSGNWIWHPETPHTILCLR